MRWTLRRGSAAAAAALALPALLAGAAAPASAYETHTHDHADGAKAEFWVLREQAYRQDPRGPFTAIAAHYLAADGAVTLRLQADSLVASEDGDAPGVRILRDREGFTIEPVAGPGRALILGGTAVTEAMALGPEPGDALDLRLGRFLLSFGVQDARTARVLVHDPLRLVRFAGFPVFPQSSRFRAVARCIPADGDTLELGTTRGLTKPFVRAATLEFEIDGARCRLAGFRAPGEGPGGPLFVPFRDRTTGDATYGVGRYLTVTPEADGTAVLDFNQATNPWCAYSPFYNCVLPPPGNTLGVPIEAGEKTPGHHH